MSSRRAGKSVTPAQQAVHLAVLAWRDRAARLDDESCDAVLANYMLMQLARAATRMRAGLLAACPNMRLLPNQRTEQLRAPSHA